MEFIRSALVTLSSILFKQRHAYHGGGTVLEMLWEMVFET